MRILRVIHSLRPENGGPAEGIRAVSAELGRLGHEVEVASLDRPESPWFAHYAPLKCHGLGNGSRGYGYAPGAVRLLRELAAAFPAVIVHGVWNYHSLATFRALRKLSPSPPYFLYPHGMLDPWFEQTYPLKHLKKCLYWKLFEGPVFNHAHKVIFTSREEEQRAINAFRPYRPHSIVLPYGTITPPPAAPADLAAFRATCPDLGKRPFWLFMSRLHVKKGVDLLLDAYLQLQTMVQANPAAEPLPDLVLAGPAQDQPYAEALRQKALSNPAGRNLSRPRIHFPGMLQGPAKWGALHACEAFILPSHQENFGIVVAEALACSRPVAISNKVNIWREIQQAGAGFVEDDTSSGCLKLLQALARLSPPIHKTCQNAAKACFLRHFHAKAAAEALDRELHTLAAST